jgi:flavin reductase (DIM6/NTAB) family NADH-FMN oxidoreductase RutF
MVDAVKLPVDTTAGAEAMADAMFGPGIQIVSATYTGDPASAGIYSDGDKIAPLRTRPGNTGAPILLDALSYVEARVTGSLDNEENTIFVGDVVGAERLNAGGRLDIGEAWTRLGTEWTEEYERNHEAQVDHCRTMRGLPIPAPTPTARA